MQELFSNHEGPSVESIFNPNCDRLFLHYRATAKLKNHLPNGTKSWLDGVVQDIHGFSGLLTMERNLLLIQFGAVSLVSQRIVIEGFTMEAMVPTP